MYVTWKIHVGLIAGSPKMSSRLSAALSPIDRSAHRAHGFLPAVNGARSLASGQEAVRPQGFDGKVR